MKHVLVAIDESNDRAVAQAETVIELFGTSDVTAHLFHDFTDNPEGATIRQVGSVTRAADLLRDAGVPIEYHETSGDPSETIVQTAEDLDVDAIVIGGRKRSPAGKLLFGSVAQEVILGTTRPVLVCSAES